VKRKPPVVPGGLPPELVLGPATEDYGARRAWRQACTDWSRVNGHGWNGWLRLLPPDVRRRYMPSARERVADQAGAHYDDPGWDRWVPVVDRQAP
jgi:hypothetical protein